MTVFPGHCELGGDLDMIIDYLLNALQVSTMAECRAVGLSGCKSKRPKLWHTRGRFVA